jgi:hypothetical protein
MIDAAVTDPAGISVQSAPVDTVMPLKIFVSYAHVDEAYRAALEKYLIVLKMQRVIEHWDDRILVAGDKWDQEINENLEKAHVIVLLVSIDFLNSDYIRTKEMRRAMERLGAGEAVVVPVIIRSTVDWDKVLGLGTLQALPTKPGAEKEILPVKKWDDPDEAWECVVTGLRRTIEKFRKSLQNRTPAPVAPSAAPAPAPSAASATSAAGLKALRALIANPAVTLNEVADRFGADFAAASQHISVLGDYKDIHDALHNLHFQCYNFVLLESRRVDASEVNWEGLAPAEHILRQIIATITTVAARPALPAGETAFLPELQTAATELAAALEACDPAALKKAARRISRVLAIQPSRINLRLSDTARELPLAALESSLTQIRGQLTPGDLATPEGQRFAAGVEALTRLRAGVKALCDEHDAWQEIDSEMRRIEAQLGSDLGDLEFSWEGLRKKIAALCVPSRGVWSAVLNEEIQKLDSALAAGVPPKITQAFRRCYSKAGARFYDVDFELKSLCDELRKVGTELDKLLKQP